MPSRIVVGTLINDVIYRTFLHPTPSPRGRALWTLCMLGASLAAAGVPTAALSPCAAWISATAKTGVV